MRSQETKEHNSVNRTMGENLKEEGDENNEKFSNTEIGRGVVECCY